MSTVLLVISPARSDARKTSTKLYYLIFLEKRFSHILRSYTNGNAKASIFYTSRRELFLFRFITRIK